MEIDVDAVFFLGVTCVAAFYYSFRFLRHTRLIEDTPTSKIRSAHQGYVEIEGFVSPMDDAPLASPLTKSPCVWWFYEIEKRVRRNKSDSWKTIDKKTSDTPFYLEDNTGRCLINPAGAEVVTTLKHRWHGGSPWPDKPPGKSGFFSSSHYRYTERLISPASMLYALGLFSTRSGHMDTAEENTALREKLVEWKQDAERMKLLDVNRDGEIDIKEWEAARIVALKELRREHQAIAAEGLHTMAKPGQSGQPFLLSAVLQHDLCKRWRWYAGLCFGYFLASGAVVVWQLIEYGLIGG